MTTVQLSSTFNTVHKNTSHINEQSVYTQGWPTTCDHAERLYFSLPVPGCTRETGHYVQKRFSARVAGRAKKGRNVPRESTISPGVEIAHDDVTLKCS